MRLFKRDDLLYIGGFGLKKGDIIEMPAPYRDYGWSPGSKYIVTKVYRDTLWGRVLDWLRITHKRKGCVRINKCN